MRYRGKKICPDERQNERTNAADRQSENIKPSSTPPGVDDIKQCRESRLYREEPCLFEEPTTISAHPYHYHQRWNLHLLEAGAVEEHVKMTVIIYSLM